MSRSNLVIALLLAAPIPVFAEELTVNPDLGNSGFSAVFDAVLGERITAVSSSVGCEVAYDAASGKATVV